MYCSNQFNFSCSSGSPSAQEASGYFQQSPSLTFTPPTQQQKVEKKLPSMRHRIKENSRLLPQRAIDIMTDWYDKHYSNPYPTFRECEILANAGQITVNQVKQWFVNVRRRTQNQFRKKRSSYERKKSIEQDKSDLQLNPIVQSFDNSPVEELNRILSNQNDDSNNLNDQQDAISISSSSPSALNLSNYNPSYYANTNNYYKYYYNNPYQTYLPNTSSPVSSNSSFKQPYINNANFNSDLSYNYLDYSKSTFPWQRMSTSQSINNELQSPLNSTPQNNYQNYNFSYFNSPILN